MVVAWHFQNAPPPRTHALRTRHYTPLPCALQTADYVRDTGATRSYEPWRDKEATAEEMKALREEEESGNAMKALENRTMDSKREMDIMNALDEMRSLKARHNKVRGGRAWGCLGCLGCFLGHGCMRGGSKWPAGSRRATTR